VVGSRLPDLPPPGRVVAVWTNWSGEQRCAPAAIEVPESEQDVVAAVRRAAAAGRVLRVAGSGHSFTDIACTDGTLVSLRRMGRLLDADPATGLVRVQAGITLHALGEELARRGLALENQGDIDAQTLAGALATATHGTGTRFGNLSSRVAGMRLVTGTGDLLDLDGGDELRAARVGLGALGVVTEVVLRCVPAFTLERIDEPMPLAKVIERLDELADGHDHFELFAFPYADRVLVRRSTRSDREPRPRTRMGQRVKDHLENEGMTLAGRIARVAPRAVPVLNRALTALISKDVVVDRSHRVYASRRDVRFTEMEYAVPREHARAAVEGVLGMVTRRRLPIAFPIEVRFVAADDALLSPAHGRDTCYVAVHQHAGQEFAAYFHAVEQLMDGLDGRPHWGKRHEQSAATLAGRYPGWAAFQAVRNRLDPERRFTNPYVRRVLGA
jgi:FAD-linked oxidoreductase